jgi:hypothetical protein
MKLIKGQRFKIEKMGPQKMVPIFLIKEGTISREFVPSSAPTYQANYGFARWNPFVPVTAGTYEDVLKETKEEIYLFVDRNEDLEIECLEVGFAGKLHKFLVSKGKEAPFKCYLSEDNLQDIIEPYRTY